MNAIQSAMKLAKHFSLIGTLAVEMFVLEDGTIYINELAPRPHNSGHYTIDGCETSQFEQHIRAITGFPLGKTTLWKPCVMVNLLGSTLTLQSNTFHTMNMQSSIFTEKQRKRKTKDGTY